MVTGITTNNFILMQQVDKGDSMSTRKDKATGAEKNNLSISTNICRIGSRHQLLVSRLTLWFFFILTTVKGTHD
jgi:hypothetical protein